MTVRTIRRVAVGIVSVSVAAGCGGGASAPRHAPPTAKPVYSTPPASAVIDAGNYQIRPCPASPPSRGGTWFAAQSIAGKPGAGSWTSTSLIDAGTIDVHDGEFWDNGGEFLADQAGASTTVTRVKAGNPHVVLLLLNGKGQPAVAAVEVRIGAARPTEWRQLTSLGGMTGAHQLAVAGHAALEGIRRVRSLDDAFNDLDATRGWLTPCLRYSIATDAESSPSTVIDVRLPGNGGWPGAVGYDAAGNAADLVISIGVVPWSLLGLPGKPPQETVAVEPSSAATTTPK